MKRIFNFILFLVVSCSIAAYADNEQDISSIDSNAVLDDELRMPLVGPKLRTYVRTYMKNVAENLYKQGYDVETMRSGEVVVAIIPTDNLFAPNDTTLVPTASKQLDSFRQFFTPAGRYKIVLAVHSDDTGSEGYLMGLTEARVNAIMDFYEAKGLNLEHVVGFPMGDTDPVTDNYSRASRAQNRRLEIYIVPEEELLAIARKNNRPTK